MVLWSPQKRQEIFLSRFEDEALYGGAAGGGKSEALVVEALRQVHIPHYRALILRKTYPELSELIDKSQRYYRGAFPAAQWSEARHEWRFPSGAKISFGAMQHTNDRFKYQGRAYDYIAFDELTHFTQDEYLYLLSRNRASGPGTRVYLRASANPGGIGHGWVKARFLTPAPPMQTIWEDVSMLTPDGAVLNAKRSRIFVPSTVFDNQILLKNDPAYAARLAALPDADKRALLYGDWDAFAGQVFSEWRADPAHYADRRYTHVVDPFPIPKIGALSAASTSVTPVRSRSAGGPSARTARCAASANFTAAPARQTRAFAGNPLASHAKSNKSNRTTPTSKAAPCAAWLTPPSSTKAAAKASHR